jgi:hypothetical protein
MVAKRRVVVGFLIIGCLLGAGAGWLLVDDYHTWTSSDFRFWRVPGRPEMWSFVGTLIGCLLRTVLGIVAESVCDIIRERRREREGNDDRK